MDAATIQNRIYAGRAKAALRIGWSCQVYRPLTQAAPLTNLITTLNAAFNAADSIYAKPNLYGKPVWFGDFDGRLTLPGDYLLRLSDGAIWYIAAQQQLLPIVLVDCPRSVKISRQANLSTVGAVGYSGLIAPTDILGSTTRWPASILIGGRVQAGNGLPAGVKEAGWRILLPPSVPITILDSDIMTDDLGRRFAIESAELSELGWRLIANEVHA